MSEKLDRIVNQFENICAEIAYIPVLSIVTGTCRVILGTAQIVGALAYVIFSFPRSFLDKNLNAQRYSWVHIQHGTVNIFLGVIEIIPFAGTVIYYFREKRKETLEKKPLYLHTGDEKKWMPYVSVVERSWQFLGKDLQACAKGSIQIRERLSAEKYSDPSYNLKIALEYIQEYYRLELLPSTL